jgi:hypothetical protein
MAKKSSEEKLAEMAAAVVAEAGSPVRTARVRLAPAGRLPKKNNPHVPRRLKKARQKQAHRAAQKAS